MTPAEIKHHRQAVPLTQGELADRVGVGVQSIRNWEAGRRHPSSANVRALARVFNLVRVLPTDRGRVPVWSDAELDDLARLLGQGETPRDVAAFLSAHHGHTRTVRAVSLMAVDLGISIRTGWHSVIETSRLLGVAERSLLRWRRRGLLPMTRSVSSHTGLPNHWWRIKTADLEAFVERHAGVEFDPARVRDRDLKARAEIAGAVNRRRVG